MSKLSNVIASIASKNADMLKLQDESRSRCDELAEEIKRIQKQTSDDVFSLKVSKSNDLGLLHKAFSAPISEWAEFLIPILNQNTNSNWELVAEWAGHTIEPGIIEKYLLHQERYHVVDGYIIQLCSDNDENIPITFESRLFSSSFKGVVRDEKNPDSMFLDDGKIDLEKAELYSFVDNESFTFLDKEKELKINFEDYYPFLREPIIKRAENYLENVIVDTNEDTNDAEMI